MSADRFRERARELWFRCVGLVRRGSLRRELADEMAFHQELLARDLGEQGRPTVASSAAARRRFGNALALRERAADAWGFPRIEDLVHDVRFGARILRRSPMFAIVAISAIALAIGINAGFFTLIDALMLQPIPVVESGPHGAAVGDRRPRWGEHPVFLHRSLDDRQTVANDRGSGRLRRGARGAAHEPHRRLGRPGERGMREWQLLRRAGRHAGGWTTAHRRR